jgi:hypothetical protein
MNIENLLPTQLVAQILGGKREKLKLKLRIGQIAVQVFHQDRDPGSVTILSTPWTDDHRDYP